MIKSYIDMTKKTLEACDKENSVIVSVLSPIEVHGPHLPLGTDLFIASRVKELTLNRMDDVNFIELPLMAVGAQALPGEGSISLKYKTLYHYLVDYGQGLKNAGFDKWVIFDNHGGFSHQLAQIDAIKKLGKIGLHLTIPFLQIYQGMNRHDLAMGLPDYRDGSSYDAHAGTNETSLYLAIDREAFDYAYPKYIPKKSLAGNLLRILGSNEIGTTLDWLADKDQPFYIGDPSSADVESGNKMLAYHVNLSEAQIMKLLTGKTDNLVLFNPIIRSLLRVVG